MLCADFTNELSMNHAVWKKIITKKSYRKIMRNRVNISGKWKALLLIVFLLPLFICNIVEYFTVPPENNRQETVTVKIEKGLALSQVADTLLFYHIIDNKNSFIYWAKILGYETRLKAGLFQIPENLNELQVLRYLIKAPPKEIFVTLIEGWDNRQIANALAQKIGLNAQKFDSLCSDEAFIRRLGIDEPNLLGYLLPDTYAFLWGTSEEQAIRFLVGQTMALFKPDSVQAALKQLKMSVHDILTLASIVEGEAILDKERATIASVYYNRLNRGMRLQADPTIQFIVEGPPRRLLLKDLEIDSPYNTYKYKGLPPGPINNPGRLSILAALFPANTNYLYFVARGDGSHVFSRTAKEHARAKQQFDKVRRRVRLEKKKARKVN